VERDALWYRVCAAIVVASGAGRKKLRKGMLLATLMSVTLAVLVSCGGSSTSGSSTNPRTPAGTYNLTLVATSGSANCTVSLPVTVE
jgi:hypothetical protein